jgi:predicted Zn-dependent protease
MGLLAVAMVLALGWAHCAAVQAALELGEWRYGQLDEARSKAQLAPDKALPSLSAAEQQSASGALRWLGRAEAWGALPQPQLDLPLAWSAYLASDSAALRERASGLAGRGTEEAVAWDLVAREADRRSDAKTAVEAGYNAVAADPTARPAYVRLGVRLATAGDLASARAVLSSGIERAGADADLLYNLGLVEAYQGDLEGAIARFRAVLATAPDHREARENLAGALASVGRFGESVEEFRRAVARHPEDASLHLLLARALIGLGDREQARLELQRTLELQPDLEGAQGLLSELGSR